MLKILCDETWTVQSDYHTVNVPTIVFYGVLLDDSAEQKLLHTIMAFKSRRGLLSPELGPIEIKWDRAEREWREAQRTGSRNRYEEFLDIFFGEVAANRLSFGYMYLDKREYDRVETTFLEKQVDNRQNFFFMMYFEFLYHCFLKTQIKRQPCEIWIDNRNMGREGQQYRIGKLGEILNRRLYTDFWPKGQTPLSDEIGARILDSICLVSLAESKEKPLVQLADLCAGCVRYIIENGISPPQPSEQLALFQTDQQTEPTNGKDWLSNYFYLCLRRIRGYEDLNLCNASYHYRFNIFPFRFRGGDS